MAINYQYKATATYFDTPKISRDIVDTYDDLQDAVDFVHANLMQPGCNKANIELVAAIHRAA